MMVSMKELNKMRYLRNILAGLVLVLLALPATAKVWTPIDGDASYKLTLDLECNALPGQPAWNVAGDAQDRTYSTYSNAYFMPGNLTVANGACKFAVTKPGADYHTSMITSNGPHQARGYWEARIKAPLNAKGIGDNFWLVCANWACPQELDVYERSGTNPTVYRSMWNSGTGNWVGNTAVPGFTAGVWHVVGVLKTGTQITWYLDGVQKLTFPANGGAQSMQTMAGITVGPFGDLVDGSTVFPATLEVDYIHVYGNQSGDVAVTPQANYGGPGDEGTGGGGDTIAPATSITSPASGATVSGSVTVSATASDAVGVTKVDLWRDGVFFATDTTSPYSFTWNTASETNGLHTLQTKAYDVAGNVGVSTVRSVTVSNVTANLTVTSPIANATVSGTVTVSGAAGSPWVNVAVFNAAGVKIGNDAAPVSGAYSTTVNTAGMSNGSQVWTVWAWSVPPGGSGGTSASTTITVNKQCVC